MEAWDIVNRLLGEQGSFRTGQVAKALGVTRQAAHRKLRSLVQAGHLVREGSGRGARYRAGPALLFRRTYPREGLQEDAVWKEARSTAPSWRDLPDNGERILNYAMSKLVNNAIDHSGSREVTVLVLPSSDPLGFEVVDEGVGIFRHICSRLGLPDALSAIQELSKGKLTTDPGRHTGEGIFFVSRIADFFEIDSDGTSWKVDNARGDMSVGSVPPRRGTRVRFEVAPGKRQTLAELFARYTDNFEFSRTRIVVRLFEIGTRFVSRSEAGRLLGGLERFREVVLDFKGVVEIGQGFADEVFRVWAAAHPETRLRRENAEPAVEFMIRRARPD